MCYGHFFSNHYLYETLFTLKGRKFKPALQAFIRVFRIFNAATDLKRSYLARTHLQRPRKQNDQHRQSIFLRARIKCCRIKIRTAILPIGSKIEAQTYIKKLNFMPVEYICDFFMERWGNNVSRKYHTP